MLFKIRSFTYQIFGIENSQDIYVQDFIDINLLSRSFKFIKTEHFVFFEKYW